MATWHWTPRHATCMPATPPTISSRPSTRNATAAPTAPAIAHTRPLIGPARKMPQELLIDVRSPLEFSTGPLASDIAPTVNIEYTHIDSLADIYAQQHIAVSKDDHITLYCRSGRRSGIAKQRLEELGFSNVRDIGGFEEAKRVLDREMVGRQIEEGLGGEGASIEKDDGRGGARKEGLEKLLKGLEACDA